MYIRIRIILHIYTYLLNNKKEKSLLIFIGMASPN
jgi:hypothetical protein